LDIICHPFVKDNRRLHCKDPRLVENFVCLYYQFAHPLNLFQRAQDLEKKALLMLKSEAISEYEELNTLRCEATAFAEKHCRKLRTGQVALSPEVNESRLKIKAWLLLIARTKH